MVTEALVLGWAAGVMTDVSEAAVGVLIAFVSGAVVLNVLKEELPEECQSRFSAFALGPPAIRCCCCSYRVTLQHQLAGW